MLTVGASMSGALKLGEDCTGKKRFDSMRRAQKVARRSRRSRDANMHPYRCSRCHGFHIGTLTLRSQRGRPRPAPEEYGELE